MPTHVLELFKNMCGHTCSQGVENKCLRRCKTMGPSVSRTCRNNRNPCYFSPGDQNFADQTAPVLGSRNGPQNGGHSFSLNLICLCPDDLAPVLGSVSGPQNGGRFVGEIFCRRAKNSASCDCFRRYATEVLHTAGFPWFAAPRAIVLHALRTFMPTHVLELGRPTLATLESTAFLALGLGPSMDKIFARVVIRLAASHCS